jgi:hypothetical protein
MSLKKKVKQDTEYLKYKDILTTVSATDCDKIKKEAAYLHKIRKSRMLYESRVSPGKLQDAILLDLSNRARLVELTQQRANQQELLATAINLCKKHLRASYSDDIAAYGKTKEERMLVVDRVFSAGNRKLGEIDAAIASLNAFIQDIDRASFMLTNVKETLKMFLDKRESVVS